MDTATTDADRPQEGDLIYHPIITKIFEVAFVDHDEPFYQLDNNPVYKIRCKQFEYSQEAIDTGMVSYDPANYSFTKTFDCDIFSQSNIIHGIGVRPHKIIYDSENNLSLVLNSGNRTLSLVDFDSKDHKLVNTLDLDFLGDTYSRSISLINGLLYFASGPNQITETIYDKDSIFVVGKYPVPEGFESMNDIFKSSNGWIYFTATSNSKIVRARSFSEFSKGDYEDISDKLGIEGNPYYLSEFDQKVYVTEIAESSAIIWFKDNIGSEIIEFGRLMNFGAPNKQDFLRKALLQL